MALLSTDNNQSVQSGDNYQYKSGGHQTNIWIQLLDTNIKNRSFQLLRKDGKNKQSTTHQIKEQDQYTHFFERQGP